MLVEKNTIVKAENLVNTPSGAGLFQGIGDNFSNSAQIICELIDDSVSNIVAHSDAHDISRDITLALREHPDDVTISVTDGGTGICDLNNALIYYKGNMKSSGVELRINGRAIEHGLFDRVWGEQIHPSQNRFLVQVNMEADDAAALPATKNTKTSFCEADPRLKSILAWIATYVERPAKELCTLEQKLVQQLAESKGKESGVLRTTREEQVFTKIGLKAKADLFVGYTDKAVLFEAKAGNSKALDLYQLRMYVDGCAIDGKEIDEAVLIATQHPREVCVLLDILNEMIDPAGRPYHFRLATWSEEGIRVEKSR